MSDNEADVPATTRRLSFDAPLVVSNEIVASAPVDPMDEANAIAQSFGASGITFADSGIVGTSPQTVIVDEVGLETVDREILDPDDAPELTEGFFTNVVVTGPGELGTGGYEISEPADIGQPLEAFDEAADAEDIEVDDVEEPEETAGTASEAPADPVGEQAADDPEIVVDPSKLDQLSVEELQKVEDEAHRKIQEKKQAEKKAVIDQIVTVTKQFGVTVEELVDALGGLKIKRKGVKAKAKYLNPETGVSWSGRGKEPTWLRGKNREDFRIG